MSRSVKIGLVPWEKTFSGDGAFRALWDAEAWLKERGYSSGPLCGDLPVGIQLGDHLIHKWRNLSPAEIRALDGRMVGEWRNGPVAVRLKRKPEGEP